MILKAADDRSSDLAELDRLLAASPRAARPSIEKQIAIIRSGSAGERNAAHFINREFGQSSKIALIHDLRIGVDGDFAQIDHLMIHRFQAVAWILETKNYSGRLSCDEHGDWTVWRNSKPQPIPSPVSQAQRQCRLLERWLKDKGISWIRHVHPVVLISPTSSVDRRNLRREAHVVKSDNFAAWWTDQADKIGFGTALQIMGRHMVSGMSQADFDELGGRLVSAHVPAHFDWQAKLGLPPTNAALPSAGAAGETAGDTASATECLDQVNVPELLTTPYGNVRISRIPDGRFAVRSDKSSDLIEIVRAACKGQGRWNPRYRNWLIPRENVTAVASALERHSSIGAPDSGSVGTLRQARS